MTVTHLTSAEEFKQNILPFDGIVLIDFWATRCSPCKMLGPIIEKVGDHYANNPKVKIVKVDVDQNQELAGAFQIQSIPTVYLLKGGQVVDRMVGVQQEAVYIAKIDGLLEGK